MRQLPQAIVAVADSKAPGCVCLARRAMCQLKPGKSTSSAASALPVRKTASASSTKRKNSRSLGKHFDQADDSHFRHVVLEFAAAACIADPPKPENLSFAELCCNSESNAQRVGHRLARPTDRNRFFIIRVGYGNQTHGVKPDPHTANRVKDVANRQRKGVPPWIWRLKS